MCDDDKLIGYDDNGEPMYRLTFKQNATIWGIVLFANIIFGIIVYYVLL